jgi:hypothetical protein
MENRNITYGANISPNLNEEPTMATYERSEMSDNSASTNKTRKPRRSAKEIQAEYEEFKALFKEGRPILEISRTLGIRKSQVDSYLMKISLEQHKRALSYEVHEGHQLPESSINFLGGGRKDIFKFENLENEDGRYIVVKLHRPCI